jgi:hypothetical protein
LDAALTTPAEAQPPDEPPEPSARCPARGRASFRVRGIVPDHAGFHVPPQFDAADHLLIVHFVRTACAVGFLHGTGQRPILAEDTGEDRDAGRLVSRRVRADVVAFELLVGRVRRGKALDLPLVQNVLDLLLADVGRERGRFGRDPVDRIFEVLAFADDGGAQERIGWGSHVRGSL